MRLKDVFVNQSGATGIEYALIAGGIAMAIVFGVMGIGSSLAGFYASVHSGLTFGG